MRKRSFLTWVICLIWLMVLAGCGSQAAQQPEPNTAADEPAAEVVEVPAEEVAEAEPTEAPAEEMAEAEPTEAPVEEMAETEPTEAPAEEMAAVVDAGAEFPPVPYGAYPAEWLNRNILGNPDAAVLVEAYEEFM